MLAMSVDGAVALHRRDYRLLRGLRGGRELQAEPVAEQQLVVVERVTVVECG